MSIPRSLFLSLGLVTCLELSLLLSLPAAEPGHATSVATLVSATAQDTTSLPAAGMLDPDFVPEVGLADAGIPFDDNLRRGILVQPDDKILIGGYGLTRLHPDGRRDTNFISGIPKSNEFVTEFFYVTDIALDNQGRILVCGSFPSVHEIARRGIARLHPDGHLDESFDPGKIITGGIVRTLAVQTNGQILIAGTFTSVGGLSRRGIARLNEDGTHDTGFDPLEGAMPTFVNSLLIQDDGAVLMSGSFTTINGTTRRGFARLLFDGKLDDSFDPAFKPGTGLFWGPPRFIALQPDGRIWITGDFGGTNLMRLRSDGSLDLGIIRRPLHQGIFTSPLSGVLQPDGRLLVGGRASALARIETDGTVDPSFVMPTFRGVASTERGPMYTALQRDGRVVVAGDFVRAGTSPEAVRPGLARLYSSDQPFFPPSFVSDSPRHLSGGQSFFLISGAPRFRIITEAASRLDPPDWTPIRTNIMGKTKTPLTIFDNAAPLYPKRFYRLVSP